MSGLRRSIHLRVILRLCFDDAGGFDPVEGRGTLRQRGGVGPVGLRPVDGVGIDTEVDKIADRSGDIEIGVVHAVGVVAASDDFSRARCGGEHRRRGP